MEDLNLTTHSVRFTNIIYDINSIVDKLNKSTSIEETKNIIKLQHNIIFTYDNLINNNREGIQNLFTSPIFLDALDSISGLIPMTESEIIFINKIIYDYFEYSHNVNSSIKEKMLAISYIINDTRIKLFTPILGINAARILSIISYSSYKIEKVVHRVNNFIINNDFDIANLLSSIYTIIFGPTTIRGTFLGEGPLPNSKFVNAFCYSMFEYCDSEDPEVIERFNQISSYLLQKIIILYDKSDIFSNILITYANMITLMNIDKDKLRFSIKEELGKMKSDVSSIIAQINYIEEYNNITIY